MGLLSAYAQALQDWNKSTQLLAKGNMWMICAMHKGLHSILRNRANNREYSHSHMSHSPTQPQLMPG